MSSLPQNFLTFEYLVDLYSRYAEELRSPGMFLTRTASNGDHDGGISRVDGELLYLLIRDLKPSNTIEFSPNEGYSTGFIARALHQNSRPHTFATFDLVELPNFSVRMRSLGLSPQLILGDALVNIPRYTESLNIKGKIDFLYIDSDHSAEFTVKYIQTIFPLLAPGCVVMIHDMSYYPNDPTNFSHYGSCKPNEIKGTVAAIGEGQILAHFFSQLPNIQVFSTQRTFGDCHEESSILPRNRNLIEALSLAAPGFCLPPSAGMGGGFPRSPMCLIFCL